MLGYEVMSLLEQHRTHSRSGLQRAALRFVLFLMDEFDAGRELDQDAALELIIMAYREELAKK